MKIIVAKIPNVRLWVPSPSPLTEIPHMPTKSILPSPSLRKTIAIEEQRQNIRLSSSVIYSNCDTSILTSRKMLKAPNNKNVVLKCPTMRAQNPKMPTKSAKLKCWHPFCLGEIKYIFRIGCFQS